jgi:hypothetical protein
MYEFSRHVGKRDGAPAQHGSAKERAEESRNCILKLFLNHADSSEDQSVEADSISS